MIYRFDRFQLDPADRRLLDDGAPVEVSGRYLDALVLLVSEAGRLVTKDRFLAEVWRGVPITDEALTQCIRSLRRALGDDATRPRFIETLPKHGYRFIAPVTTAEAAAPLQSVAESVAPAALSLTEALFRYGRAGMLGGGGAGLIGGMIYGLVGVADPVAGGGAASAVIVVACLTMMVGLLGGAAVGGGVGATRRWSGRHGPWSVLGGAAGGLVIGAVVKLVGLDAFGLLLGQAPGPVTGAPEGAALGAAIGLGAWLALGSGGRLSGRVATAAAAGLTAVAGVLISLAGGRLMGGSLDALADGFPRSNLRLDPLGALVGEAGFGPLAQAMTAGLEGLLFGAGVVAALILAERRSL